MLFQEATPDTSGYMIAGYVVAFLVMGLYVASMYLRSRNLKQDMTTLEEIDESTPAAVQKQSRPKPANAEQQKL
jgi:hypothetical protein